MEELLSCANAHITDVFNYSVTSPRRGVLASVYAYVCGDEEPRKRLREIQGFIELNDYVGFNKKLASSDINSVYCESLKNISLKDNFVSLGRDINIMFADWRALWRKNL